MAIPNKAVQVLQKLFRSLIEPTAPEHLTASITDLFVRINCETGEVSIYGDDDELIGSVVIFSWVDKGDKPSPEMRKTLRQAVAGLQAEGLWEHELFERPFSIVLVDDEFANIEELLFLDDELLQLTTPLLADLDSELSQFIDELLSK